MLFTVADVKSLFRNKHVVVMGDSVQRCIYKDIVLALQEDRLLTTEELTMKGEPSFCNDVLLYRSEMTNGRGFCEIREYQSADNTHLVHFYFLTRCYSDRMEMFLDDFRRDPPDLVIMNSCLWDISRYGPKGEEEYYHNMNILCTRMREVLPPTAVFLWSTTLPISSHIASGFLLENIKFLSETLRVAVLEANYYVTQIVTAYGFDVLDLHYYLRALINHRENDGCHWDAFANRHIIDLICVFMHDSWGIPLPRTAVDTIKQTDMELNLRHFNYDGYPNFVEAKQDRLEALAERAADNSGTGQSSGNENMDPNSNESVQDDGNTQEGAASDM